MEVEFICDFVAVISEGKLIEQGTVSDIFVNPKTELAKDFINTSLHIEIPDHYQQRLKSTDEGNLSPLLKLHMTGETANEPILSQAARLFNVDTKIISAQMDYAGDKNFGVILTELSGNRENYENAIQFFIKNQIKIEIIGYV